MGEHSGHDDKETVFKGGQRGKGGHQLETYWSNQFPHLTCRGVSPDREQEVRGDSCQSISDNIDVPNKNRNAGLSHSTKERQEIVAKNTFSLSHLQLSV